MTFVHSRIALALGATAIAAVPALAQRPLTPDERSAILQQQVSATQASMLQIQQRLESLERQIQQLVNQGEVNAHRASELESALSALKGDVNGRLNALESRPAVAEASDAAPEEAAPFESKPKVQKASVSTPELPERGTESTETAAASDPGEDAYSAGFRLWRDGKYDQSITALRAFISGFPDHRRVSFARNLIGRALLDKGEPRPAAEALLANYRANPKGERAPDSLYYLGQALMKLNQPSQACKAYAEIDDVYGASVRSDLETLVTKGKADARCS